MIFQLRFTTRQLERLAAKSEKEQKLQQTKVKKVNKKLELFQCVLTGENSDFKLWYTLYVYMCVGIGERGKNNDSIWNGLYIL